MINKAIIFATLAHEKQKRKGSDIPYILHLLEAGTIVSSMKYDEELICAAILHDTIEDAKVNYETIKMMFNEKIADLVLAQSEDKSKSWKERKRHTIEYLSKVEDEDILIVFLGDKLSNIRSTYKDYLSIGDKVWEKFNEKDKLQHKWYYIGLVNGLNKLSKYQEYSEFKELVYKVFGH
ncbi:HD domain-containing protein [Clostridium sp. MSJ-11]|uniref:HD domain-containing protein n=1 Tax=Clostridium mobile TaxID=2841512 RepID=A0ABS6EH72_9CLOT|nr:HD domain-containing protein [Clostridium mobile]MBU5484562.1 HD domain-containing protein [Clostridium mobile]